MPNMHREVKAFISASASAAGERPSVVLLRDNIRSPSTMRTSASAQSAK